MASQHARAMSPHLTIYKPQISSVLSIMHRASGAFNFFGMLFLLWWVLVVAFTNTTYYDNCVWSFFSSYFGLFILMMWNFSLFFHMCSGIRHLFWDAGKGFDIKTMTISGYAVLAVSSLLTAAVWIMVYCELMMGV